VALAGVYFIYSATVEERYLDRAVPRHLPGIQALDQMLLPFIFLNRS